MFSEQTNVLSMKELLTVFRLCDPDRTGRIKIDYLQELATSYAPHSDHLQVNLFCLGAGFILGVWQHRSTIETLL